MGSVVNLLIGMMLFSGFMLGMGLFYTNVTDAYGLESGDLRTTQNFEAVFNKTSEIGTQVQSTTGIKEVDAFLLFASSAINAALLLFDIPGIFASIFADIAIIVPGMPAWAADIFGGIVAIIILFSGVFLVITKVRL